MMNADDTAASAPRDPARDPARDRAAAQAWAAATERQVRLLAQLADTGMVLARAAGLRATAPAGGDEIADAGARAVAFGHVARAVRQTIGLEVKLRAESRMRECDPAAEAATARQLRLLQELAQISFAVAQSPGSRAGVPIFLRIARAIRRTIGAAANLRNGPQPPREGAASTPPANPAASPADTETEEDHSEGIGDVASALTETLDAFEEYYRFLKVPTAEAIALIFKTLGVPVEPGRGRSESGAESDRASAPVAGRADDGAPPDSWAEPSAARMEPPPFDRPGAGNRGPP
jgi:hypothetical protein